MTLHDLRPTGRVETPEAAVDDTHTRGDKAALAFFIVAGLLAAALIGYLLLRPTNDPTPPKPQPPVDTRVADEAAALEVAKKLPTAEGAELDALLDPALADSERQLQADRKARGTQVVGTGTYTYKVRDYVGTPGDTRVVLSRCSDLSKSKVVDAKGNRVDVPPGGNPITWTHSVMIVTKQADEGWLITSNDVTQRGDAGACSLDTPL